MTRVLSILENIPMILLGGFLLGLSILFPQLGMFLLLVFAFSLIRELMWIFHDSSLYFWGLLISFGAAASYVVWEYCWFLQFLWSPFLDSPSIPYWLLYLQEGIACFLGFIFGALIGWWVHGGTYSPPQETPIFLPLFLTGWMWYDGWVDFLVTYRDASLGIDLTRVVLKEILHWFF